MELITLDSPVTVFAAIIVVTYIFWNYWSHGGGTNGGRKLPPSLPRLPILGSLIFVPHHVEMPEFFLKKAYKKSDVVSMWAGNKFLVVLSGYESIREALVKQSLETADRTQHFLNKNFFNPRHKGIAEANYNAEFRKVHKLSIAILKEFGFGQRVMEERIRIEVEDLVKNFKDLKCEPVCPKSLIAGSVVSVISSIVLGYRMKDETLIHSVIEAVEGMTGSSINIYPVEFINSLIYLPKYKTLAKQVQISEQTLLDLGRKTIEDIKSKTSNGLTQPDSFISKYMEQHKAEFDAEQLHFITRDLIAAGLETTSTTLLWALLHLANNPDIQKKLQTEIDSVVPRERFPSLDDKSRLVYVEAFILEVMRRNTVLPLALPHFTLDNVNIREYTIPKNTIILPNLYAVHMNKNTWGDPEKFRPERFLNESRQIISDKRQKVIPFSIGKRSCLGELLARQEIYLFITGLLHSFHISPPDGVEHIEEKEMVGFIVAPVSFNIRFIPRD